MNKVSWLGFISTFSRKVIETVTVFNLTRRDI